MSTQSNTPRAILGTMNWGLEDTVSETAVLRVRGAANVKPFLDTFVAHGHVEVDTARSYCNGDTERVLGQVASESVKFATKVWPSQEGAHGAENLTNQLRKSLEALQVPKVDVFYLHYPDRTTPIEETLKAVDDLYRQGLFERFGLSNYASWEVAQIHQICKTNGYVLPTVYQGMYNPIARSVVPELLPCLKKLNISFYAYNPLGGGLLSGKIKLEDDVTEGSRYDPKTPYGNYFRERYWNRLNLEGVQILDAAAKANNLTMIEASFRWMKHHSGLDGRDGFIAGASTVKQLEENLAAFDKGPLPQAMVDAFDQAWDHVMPATRHYTRAAA
ncbi:aflatoxin B1 aldehyde reductase member 2 [Mortierella sp. GBAus27b]|nr:Aflatoxin B1 aldehyde reductase member 2 [Mortierella sp. GBA43]KAI8353699.1 aflatoxin B1 aldehyde reductase member 2 [Mortierella sp. GBAus27b]